jgi:hypothetical protein
MARPRVLDSTEDLNVYNSAVDANGVYTVVDFKKQNGKLYMRSTASNPDVNGNYQTLTYTYYNAAGVSVVSTDVWTITYDAVSKVVSEVKN